MQMSHFLKEKFLPLMVIMVLTGCVGTFSQRQEFRSIEIEQAEWVDVKIRMRAGNLSVAPGARQLMNARFDYFQPTKRPEIQYDEFEERGVLTLHQVARSSVGEFGRMGAVNVWNILLHPEIRMNLDIGLDMGSSHLKVGALNTRRVHVMPGQGPVILDLQGKRTDDLYVTVRGGKGPLEIVLPSDIGVKLQYEKGSAYIPVEGFTQTEEGVVNAQYGQTAAAVEILITSHPGPVHLTVSPEEQNLEK